MHRYTIAKRLGDGTYGEVLRAVNQQSGEVVAVKRMKRKYYSWDECMALREVQSLRKLRHPNIVKLKEVVREHDILHMVFEHMECNLYELMRDRKKFFPEAQLRNHMYQILQGLSFMHKHGYFHRDMKPENVLVSKDVTKIADFGLAREIRSRPPYTEYVSTRWYRAPEVLLRSRNYSAPIDVFAVGCIMAELYMLRPLFPGNSEQDMLHKVCQVLGTVTNEQWPEGMKLAAARRVKLPIFPKMPLTKLMPHCCPEGIALMDSMMEWNPESRVTCPDSLAHAYFQVGGQFKAPERSRAEDTTSSTDANRKQHENLEPNPKRASVLADPLKDSEASSKRASGLPEGPRKAALELGDPNKLSEPSRHSEVKLPDLSKEGSSSKMYNQDTTRTKMHHTHHKLMNTHNFGEPPLPNGVNLPNGMSLPNGRREQRGAMGFGEDPSLSNSSLPLPNGKREQKLHNSFGDDRREAMADSLDKLSMSTTKYSRRADHNAELQGPAKGVALGELDGRHGQGFGVDLKGSTSSRLRESRYMPGVNSMMSNTKDLLRENSHGTLPGGRLRMQPSSSALKIPETDRDGSLRAVRGPKLTMRQQRSGREILGGGDSSDRDRHARDAYYAHDAMYGHSQPAAVAKALGMQQVGGQGRSGMVNGKTYGSRALLEYVPSAAGAGGGGDKLYDSFGRRKY